MRWRHCFRVYGDPGSFNKTREDIHLVASASELGFRGLWACGDWPQSDGLWEGRRQVDSLSPLSGQFYAAGVLRFCGGFLCVCFLRLCVYFLLGL